MVSMFTDTEIIIGDGRTVFLQSLASIIACLHVSLQVGDRLNLAHVSLCLSGFPPPWDPGRTIALCIAVSPVPLLSVTASTCCVCLCVSAYSWKILIPLWQGCHVGDVSPAHHNDYSQGVSHSALILFFW